jgi:AcrR family transcriptional regulator
VNPDSGSAGRDVTTGVTGDVADEASDASWRDRAVARSLTAARSRAEERIQRFLDAAFSLMDEKGTTEFTIQEVIDRSKQSMRGFYQYFDGKDQLLLALFEESAREATADLAQVVDSETGPMDRLRAFTIRLHEWCEPAPSRAKRGSHNRRPIAEFSVQLIVTHPERVQAAMAPISRLLRELIDDAVAAGGVHVTDTKHAAALVQQTVMHSWFGNRLVENPRKRVSALETWEFCLHGLGG